ncbi:MAG: PAS domain S-box protein [Dehalococcoidia bacterium]
MEQLRLIPPGDDLPSGTSDAIRAVLADMTDLLERLQAAQDDLRRKDDEVQRARRETERERQRYYNLFEQAPDAYIVTDTNGTILQCNRAGADILGRKIEQITGKSLPAFFARDDRRAFRKLLNSFRASEDRQECELRLSLEAGRQPRYAQATVSVVRDMTTSGAAELLWMLRDLSGRKAAETALAQSEERHRFLTENAQDAIYLLRFLPRPHLEYVSPAIERITGHAPQEFYDDWRIVLTLVHPDDLPLAQQYVRNLQDLPTPASIRLLHKNGEVVWVEQQATLIRDSSGAVVLLEAIVRDVTERVRTEEQLERLRVDFMSLLAHQIRTPLTAIKGSAAIGLSAESPPTGREARGLFQIVDEQADRLGEFVRSILDITQIEAGLLDLRTEEVEPASLVKEAQAAFVRSGTAHKILVEMPEVLPPLKADKRRVAQVLSHLLANAAHVSPPSEPITISAQPRDDGVLIQVRDRGRGIPPEQLPLLFRKFYKIDELEDRGSGLGLAISKGIVEAHGGRIWAESAGEGEGASFNFTLPAA